VPFSTRRPSRDLGLGLGNRDFTVSKGGKGKQRGLAPVKYVEFRNLLKLGISLDEKRYFTRRPSRDSRAAGRGIVPLQWIHIYIVCNDQLGAGPPNPTLPNNVVP
jgi:hypothetical protein